MKQCFEWDEEKAKANLKKHRVGFDEATTVFTDPYSMTIHDPDHSVDEQRYIDIGITSLTWRPRKNTLKVSPVAEMTVLKKDLASFADILKIQWRIRLPGISIDVLRLNRFGIEALIINSKRILFHGNDKGPSIHDKRLRR